MNRYIRTILLSCAAVICTAFPVVADDADQTQLCAEAEARYVELYGHPSSEEEGVTVVTIYKYEFCPAKITVPVGTTVRWVNVEKRTSHSVMVQGEPESDRAFPEEIIEFTFLTTGDQQYICVPHWESRNMMGMVSVEE